MFQPRLVAPKIDAVKAAIIAGRDRDRAELRTWLTDAVSRDGYRVDTPPAGMRTWASAVCALVAALTPPDRAFVRSWTLRWTDHITQFQTRAAIVVPPAPKHGGGSAGAAALATAHPPREE